MCHPEFISGSHEILNQVQNDEVERVRMTEEVIRLFANPVLNKHEMVRMTTNSYDF